MGDGQVAVFADERSATSLAELISNIGQDEQAFAQLYAETSPAVFRVVAAVLRDHAQADEVTQDIYLWVWQNSARFKPELGSALTWLLTIAHRRAVDRVRTEVGSARRDQRFALDPSVLTEPNPVEEALVRLDAERVHQALAELPAPQREAIVLAHLGGYSHAEIAVLLDVPIGTVKSRIRAGLHRLTELLVD